MADQAGEGRPAGFPPAGTAKEREATARFQPKFGADGLLPCIVTDAAGLVLMFAHMNAEALALTLETGIAHYFSRSRNALWKKGEESGRTQSVLEMRTDCDQDALWIKVAVAEDGASCHLGFRSCFFRRVEGGGGDNGAVALVPTEAAPLFDPSTVYRGGKGE